jgi:hypothetical protein
MRGRRDLVTLLAAVPLVVGFDLSRHAVPVEEIVRGGPPKDGIPAIVEPAFVAAREATFLRGAGCSEWGTAP